jgi:hypothetical protein
LVKAELYTDLTLDAGFAGGVGAAVPGCAKEFAATQQIENNESKIFFILFLNLIMIRQAVFI